jgi:CyaY protein
MDDQQFRKYSDTSLDSLKKSLIAAEDSVDMEVEDQAGALHISFEEPPAKFIISPNSAARQIWISALSTSFKLDWSESQQEFVFSKTGEKLKTLVSRLINEQLGDQVASLDS